MITFDLNTGIRELLEADPEVIKSADLSLSMLKSQTARPSFDKCEGEIIIHVPVKFDAATCKYQTEIMTEMKTKSVRKQSTPLMIYIEKETGEIITQDPAAAKGQLSLL